MTGTLRAARILSSETDNTIKQEQNVNIKITKPNNSTPQIYGQSPEVSSRPYPNIPPMNPNINFTQMGQQEDAQPAGNTQTTNLPYVYPQQINNNFPLDRGIADLGIESEEMDKKNRFL